MRACQRCGRPWEWGDLCDECRAERVEAWRLHAGCPRFTGGRRNKHVPSDDDERAAMKDRCYAK